MRTRNPLGLVLLAIITGCSGSVDVNRTNPAAVPPPVFKSIRVNSLGLFYGIQVEGIEDYIEKYGTNAWRVGLQDGRLLRDLYDFNQGLEKTQSKSIEQDLRVKDVFLNHHYHSIDPKETHGVRVASTWAQRDEEIEKVLREMKLR